MKGREPIRIRQFRSWKLGMFIHWGVYAVPARGERVPATGRRCAVAQRGDRIFLSGLPRRAPDRIANVIALEFDRKPVPAPQRPLGEI